MNIIETIKIKVEYRVSQSVMLTGFHIEPPKNQTMEDCVKFSEQYGIYETFYQVESYILGNRIAYSDSYKSQTKALKECKKETLAILAE